MSAVVSLVINLISIVIAIWIGTVGYYSFEEYRTGTSTCIISKDSISKANNKLTSWYDWSKEKTEETVDDLSSSSFNNIENFEEKELNPHPFTYGTGQLVEEPVVDEEQDYSEILASQLEPVVFKQHEQYVKENNKTTTGASTQVERSDREEVVPTWGLRRINYGKDILSKNALSVPSFEYEAQTTSRTNLMNILGA